jgi:hypothetical protein
MPLIICQELHFTHGVLVACGYLNKKFPGWWIGKSGWTSWPPCSPDLDPMDFYLWSYIKPSVYLSPVDDEETLCSRIVAGFRTIRDMPWIRDCLLVAMRCQAEACIQAGDGHTEHLL